MKEYSKYNVNKTKEDKIYNDIVFDSAMEMRYYRDVVLPGVENGSILSFERQKRYTLQPSFTRSGKKVLPIDYKADFCIFYSDGSVRVIDIKGCAEPQAKLKRKMFWYVYPDIDYVWLVYSPIDGGENGWVTYEEKQAGVRARKKAKKKLKGVNKEITG